MKKWKSLLIKDALLEAIRGWCNEYKCCKRKKLLFKKVWLYCWKKKERFKKRERKKRLKDITVILPQEVEKVEIIILGCIHRGSPQFNEKMFLDTVKLIDETPNLYTIINGDAIDNAIKNSKSNVHYAVESPQASMNWLIDKLQPLADKGKILAIGSGNHEERTERETGQDPTWWMAKCLGIEERYFNGLFVIYLSMGMNRGRIGKYHTFTINGGHGAGGGTTPQGASKKLVDMSEIVVNADVYIRGHSHQPMWIPGARYVVDARTKKHYYFDPLLVGNQAYLNFEGSYAEKKMYKPSSKRIPVIILQTFYDIKKADLRTLQL